MRVFAGFLILCLAAAAAAAEYRAGPEHYREYLSRLQAGDRLILEAGDYPRGLPLQNLAGRPDAPIIIAGPSQGAMARFLARPGANTVSLVNVAHVVIRHLELDGRNLPVDAVKAEGHARFAHYVTLENLYIHDHAASQQNVGISSKCPAFGWVIRGNRIERVGTGMYLGNSDGSAPFVAGLIENNHISETLGYNLQIKHQKARPADLPEAGLRHDTIIRRNVFSKEKGGTADMPRPNVLVGHFPPEGEGADDGYLVYGNRFWQNPREALFQGEGNIALYNNELVNHAGAAIHIQPHNDVPKRVDIARNTVLARDEGIAVRLKEGQADYPRRVWQNLVFAGRPLLGGEQSGNRTGTLDEAARYLTRPSADWQGLDLTPRFPLLADLASVPERPDYPEFDLDVAGLPRDARAIGGRTGPASARPATPGRDGR